MTTKLGKVLRHSALIFCGVVAAAGLGCLNNRITVKQTGTQFNDRQDRLALSAGLWLDNTVRDWVYTYKKMGVTYNFALGKALEVSAPESLRKSFQDVAIVVSPDSMPSKVDRVVTLKFGPGTDWKFGPVVMATNHATVELLCEISDKKGKVLWSGSAVGHADKTAGMYGYMPGFANSWINKAYGRIVNDALTEALEKLNDQILTSGKAAITG